MQAMSSLLANLKTAAARVCRQTDRQQNFSNKSVYQDDEQLLLFNKMENQPKQGPLV